MKKLLQGIVASLVIVVVPGLGKPQIWRAPQIWVLVVIGIVASLFQPDYDPFRGSPNEKDKGTASQIIWSIYITQLAVFLEATYLRYPRSVVWDSVTTFALVLMLSGLAIRSWGFLTLGRCFTWHVSVRPDQPVIESGPYAFVRHPGYVGAYLTYVGSALFLHAWLSAVLSAVVLSFAFLRRVHREEMELRAELGERYDSYSRRVARFIPGVW